MVSWNKILIFFSKNARFKNVLIKEKLDALTKVVLLILFNWVYWVQLTNISCSFCCNQLVCCESWFKFTWQLQAKLTAHSWCWEHFCVVKTILTHPTDINSYRNHPQSLGNLKPQSYHINDDTKLMIIIITIIFLHRRCSQCCCWSQWQCWQELIAKAIQFKPLSLLITASGNVIWLQQSFNLRENFSRIFHVDFLMNLSFINFTRRGSCKRNFELQ